MPDYIGGMVAAHPFLLWLGLALLILAADLILPEARGLYVATGAGMGAVLALLTPLPLLWQVSLALVTSSVAISWGRSAKKPSWAENLDALAGFTTVVTRRVDGASGEVSLGDDCFWARMAEEHDPLPIGEPAEVIDVDGRHLLLIPKRRPGVASGIVKD